MASGAARDCRASPRSGPLLGTMARHNWREKTQHGDDQLHTKAARKAWCLRGNVNNNPVTKSAFTKQKYLHGEQ